MAGVRAPTTRYQSRATRAFFFHDQGVFDFSDMRLPAEGSDSLPIDEAEHLTNFFVVNALRSHPRGHA